MSFHGRTPDKDVHHLQSFAPTQCCAKNADLAPVSEMHTGRTP